MIAFSPLRGLALLGLGALGALACSSSPQNCAPKGTLTVKVVDQSVDDPNAFLCNASVTLTSADGGAPAALPEVGAFDGSTVGCEYQTTAGPGTYTVTATAPNYTTNSTTVILSEVNCVTSSSPIQVTIAPNDQP